MLERGLVILFVLLPFDVALEGFAYRIGSRQGSCAAPNEVISVKWNVPSLAMARARAGVYGDRPGAVERGRCMFFPAQ